MPASVKSIITTRQNAGSLKSTTAPGSRALATATPSQESRACLRPLQTPSASEEARWHPQIPALGLYGLSTAD